MQIANSSQQPLVFASEEERAKALADLPDRVPDNISVQGHDAIQAWEEEQESLQSRIEEAKIGQTGTQEQETSEKSDGLPDSESQEGGESISGDNGRGQNQPEPDTSGRDKQGGQGASDTGYDPKDWTVTLPNGEKVVLDQRDIPKDRKFTFKNIKEALNGYVNAQKHLDYKNSQHARELEQMRKSQEELQGQIEKLNKRGTQTAASPQLPEGIPSDEQLQQAQKQVDELDQKLDSEEDEFESVKIMRQMRKAERAYKELQTRRDQYERKQQEEKSAEQARKEEEVRAREQIIMESKKHMSDFLQNSDELKTSRSYDQIEQESIDFGKRLAAVHFNVPENQVTWEMWEQANQEYLQKTPALMNKLRETGFGPGSTFLEPSDYRRYLLVSELDNLRQGKQLNPQTGRWEPVMINGRQVTHPDMESAYDYYKRIHGIRTQERIRDIEQGAQEVLKVMGQLNSGAIEIGSEQVGPQREHVDSVMSPDNALKTLELLEKEARAAGFADMDAWIELLSRQNVQDSRVSKWEECVKALESAPKNI